MIIKKQSHFPFYVALFLCSFSSSLWCQKILVEGYVQESSSHDFIDGIKIKFSSLNAEPDEVEVISDAHGLFMVMLTSDRIYELTTESDDHQSFKQKVSTIGKETGDKIHLALSLVGSEEHIIETSPGKANKEMRKVPPANSELPKRNLSRETGLVAHQQRPIDRISHTDEHAQLENRIADFLQGTSRHTSKSFKKIPPDFSGFTVQIINSGQGIKISQITGVDKADIWIDQNADGSLSYLVGSFRNKGDAKHYFHEIVAPIYPNAKIIEFIRGSRL